MNSIQNSSVDDITEILKLYKHARAYQYFKDAVLWPEIPIRLITKEIIEKHQWKLIIDGQIACVWATTFQDPHIWEEKDNDPAVYIHRIAVNPTFRGSKLVREIVEWAKVFAKRQKKLFIRLDTVGENQGLIRHYTSCGFNYLGLVNLKNTSDLPSHYATAPVCLFEMEVG
jgi:GNAT superfamily N-acetyltransferase